jgi:hypothetical protein
MTRTSSSSSGRSYSSGRSSPSYSSSSYDRSSSKTTPKPSPPPPTPPTPSTTQSQSSNNKSNKSSGGVFMSSVTDGFSFGFGSSIAHRVVGCIFDSSSTYPQSYPPTKEVETHHHNYHSQKSTDISKSEYISKPACKSLQEEYLKCIQSYTTNFQSTCDFLLNMFKDCELEAKKY